MSNPHAANSSWTKGRKADRSKSGSGVSRLKSRSSEKTLKSMENAHRRSAIKRRMREKSGTAKTDESNFLDDLLKGIASFIVVPALVSIKHRLNRRLSAHRAPSFSNHEASANRDFLRYIGAIHKMNAFSRSRRDSRTIRQSSMSRWSIASTVIAIGTL